MLRLSETADAATTITPEQREAASVALDEAVNKMVAPPDEVMAALEGIGISVVRSGMRELAYLRLSHPVLHLTASAERTTAPAKVYPLVRASRMVPAGSSLSTRSAATWRWKSSFSPTTAS